MKALQAAVVACPSTSMLSFTAKGTPHSAPLCDAGCCSRALQSARGSLCSLWGERPMALKSKQACPRSIATLIVLMLRHHTCIAPSECPWGSRREMLHLQISTAMPLPSRPRRVRCDQHHRLLADLPAPGRPPWLSLPKGVKCQGKSGQTRSASAIPAAESIPDAKRPQQHVKCAPDFHLNLDFLDTVLCLSA